MTLGWRALGASNETPNLDELATEGLRFTPRQRMLADPLPL